MLYAEDNEFARKGMVRSLRMRFPDHELEIFTRGDSLRERLEGDQDFQIVLLDNEMPGSNGSDIIKDYASKLENVHFILCYSGDDEIGNNAIGNRAYDYFLKPYTKGLLDSLGNLLE